MEVQRERPASEPRPQGAIFIAGIVGVLTLLLWGSFFALAFIRG